MARTGSVSGKIIIAETGEAVDFSVNISPSFGNIIEQVTGKKVIVSTNGTDLLTLEMGSVTTASFIWIRSTDNINGNSRSIEVILNADGSHSPIAPTTEFLHIASENGGVTGIQVIAQASGNDTLLEYAIAGV